MDFDEFKEAIGACAVYKIPDPYVPLHRKLHRFVCKQLIPGAYAKLKKPN